jgi:hypothetical protein
MPALDIDHEHVRAIASQVGLREAARQCGIPEGTVLWWAKEEKWTERAEAIAKVQQEALQTLRAKQGHQSQPINAADVLVGYSGNTRLKLALVADKQAENLAVRDPDELVLMASTVKTVIDGAAKLHGWEAGAQVTVNFDLISDNLHSIPIVDAP